MTRHGGPKVRSDRSRSLISFLVSSLVVVGTLPLLALTTGVALDPNDGRQIVTLLYLVYWPAYTVIYVAWSARTYVRLDSEPLRRSALIDERDHRNVFTRTLGAAGVADTAMSGAVVAVFVTIFIAQQPVMREEPIYVALTFLTVAASWTQMMFSFALSYMRLAARTSETEHFRFSLPGPARFPDYLTLASLVSSMAATTPAEMLSPAAWRLVRANVLVAFGFNSVIVAMMVSLLFGGFLS
ncbi:DUF1345 domain-containing protein [Labedella endophytica]|uniref:DUF1345 domain-containing protein n=1 Tax=Labedella endophytica TaxID=1523160 RepID=A0A3S0X4Q2_9MICO|nr:DUF1345 domain-containing protein [Labedella endophytica]RUQ98163.1 DUF1345 domain-containing protein [Labedella endophytica]